MYVVGIKSICIYRERERARERERERERESESERECSVWFPFQCRIQGCRDGLRTCRSSRSGLLILKAACEGLGSMTKRPGSM